MQNQTITIQEAFLLGSSIEAQHIAIVITSLVLICVAVWSIVSVFKHTPEGQHFLQSSAMIISIAALFLFATLFFLNFWR